MSTFKFAPNLQNLLEQKELKWIFVGGKGGVGKTTVSTSLAINMTKYKKKVLIISTDPAHNLSDAFNQKISNEVTPIKGFDNLFGMEMDPEKETQRVEKLNQILNNTLEKKQTFGNEFMDEFMDINKGFPGIDEAMNLKFIGNLADNKEYDLVIFDTAPTGHTLRLLDLPGILGKTLEKILEIKANFGDTLTGLISLMGQNQDEKINKLFENVLKLKESLEKVATVFKDPDCTTFIAVCIPEFLSIYETERLVEKLVSSNIDVRNVVVNQVLMQENKSGCKMCQARMNLQTKYLTQIEEMFEDFHIIKVPQQKNEIRGPNMLGEFSRYLMEAQ